jgi:cell division protein FtsB
VSGDHGFLRRERLQKERDELRAENARLLTQKDRLLQEVRAQQNDPLSLERLAREKYWLVGPGEKIYRFEDDEVVPEVELPEANTPEEP